MKDRFKFLPSELHDGTQTFENDLPDCAEIDPERTLACARQLDEESWVWLKEQPNFLKLLRMVFPEDKFPNTEKQPLAQLGVGMLHTIGLILLTLDARRTGGKVLWRFPESYLHPAQQVGLGDLIVALTR